MMRLAQEIVDFWFAESSRPFWFERSDAFDEELGRRFAGLPERGAAGAFENWRGERGSCLALVLMLDQFPRNLYRGSPRAFVCDGRAREVARGAIAAGLDHGASLEERLFFYLPFEHSEAMEDQIRAVQLFEGLGDADYLHYAVRHRDVIARFGRFPHRNAAIGRTSTAEEEAFLKEPGSSFG